jgi:hypothetical protein
MKYGQSLAYGGSQYNGRRSAEICHWCGEPAFKQEIDSSTRQYVGACKQHAPNLKTLTNNRTPFKEKPKDAKGLNKAYGKIVTHSHTWYRGK